jgi:hypothetical protein
VRKTADERLAEQLYDALVAAPEGLSMADIAETLGVTHQRAALALRCLRLMLGGGDSINVPFRAEGRRRLYYLAGTSAGGNEWQAIRMKTMLSRIHVDLAWWSSMVAATDGRTTEGRLARAAHRHFSRLAEGVAEYWKADDPRRIRDREIAELAGLFTEVHKATEDYFAEHPMKWNDKLPKRTPGKYAKDPVWD